MRAATLIALLASIAAPGAVGAQALPPAPYQADNQGAPTPGASPTIDRYGGFHQPTSFAQQPTFQTAQQPTSKTAQQPAPRPARSGAYLAWNGKTETPPQTVVPARGDGWSAMSRQWDAPPSAPRQAQYTPPPAQAQTAAQGQGAWRPLYPQGASTPQTAPTSIYDAPSSAPSPAAPSQPPAPQYRQAQASQGGPRFYSLHREYGIQPDAIPLPPQFFGPTADLSTPVTDPLARRATTVNGQTRTAAVPDAGETQ